MLALTPEQAGIVQHWLTLGITAGFMIGFAMALAIWLGLWSGRVVIQWIGCAVAEYRYRRAVREWNSGPERAYEAVKADAEDAQIRAEQEAEYYALQQQDALRWGPKEVSDASA